MSLVSIREAAKTLKVSERHVRRMLERNIWPYHRVGDRAIRINVEEIIKLTRDDGHQSGARI